MKPSRKKDKIILVQPTMGMSGEFVRHMPLSLLYVASGLVKAGYKVKILDNRVRPQSWEKELTDNLGDDVLFVGITVMSGSPIANAIAVSKLVKAKGDIPVVWGGPHPTIMPEQVLEKDFVDYVISGSGVAASAQLASFLAEDKEAPENLKGITGLGYKLNGTVTVNPSYCGFEHVHYKDIPYSIIKDFSVYGHIGSTKRTFAIFSSYGCVYNCTFCVSPRLYRNFKTKWVTLPIGEVIEHIEFLHNKYNAGEIYFYDDDSFINLDHVGNIIKEVKRHGFKIRMNFRGARVNEVMKMDDRYLDDLADAGTHILHIGIESGSQRVLDLFKKGIKVNDIIEINRKLAKNEKILAFYNWIVGTPTETINDVRMTMKLILQLIKENPRCCIFQPNKFRPIPGTELFDLALKNGYKMPSSLGEWIGEEVEGDKAQPWYSAEAEKLIKMAQVTSYFIDDKPGLLLEKRTMKNSIIKLVCSIYKPIARYRFEHGMTAGLIEYPIYQFFSSRYRS
jgi:radical SAM superfamily enzyme YgiQ (UPF0313 family)